MMNRMGKFYKPLSNGLCNKQLAFGPETSGAACMIVLTI